MLPTNSNSSGTARALLVQTTSHTFDDLAAQGGNPAALLGSLLANAPSLARVPSRGLQSPVRSITSRATSLLASPTVTSPQQQLPAADSLVCASAPAAAVHQQRQQQHVSITVQAAPQQKATATYEVSGMSCGSCVAALEGGLSKQPGVLAATASLLTASLCVTFDPSLIDAETVAAAADDLGYPSRLLSVQVQQGPGAVTDLMQGYAGDSKVETLLLSVGGMSCASCVAAVEAAVKEVSNNIDHRNTV